MATKEERQKALVERIKRRSERRDDKIDPTIAGLLPETQQARTAFKDRQRARRVEEIFSMRPVPKMPGPVALKTSSNVAAQVEIAKLKEKLAGHMAQVQASDDPYKLAEIARNIFSDIQSRNATVGAARIGAQGKVLAELAKRRNEVDKQRDDLDDRYSLERLDDKTQQALRSYQQSLTLSTGANATVPQFSGVDAVREIETKTTASNMSEFLNQEMSKLLDLQPGNEEAILAQLDKMHVERGLPSISGQIAGLREQQKAGTLTDPTDASILTSTERLSEEQAANLQQRLDLEKEHSELDTEIGNEMKKLGVANHGAEKFKQIFQTLKTEVHGPEGVPSDKTQAFEDQIKQLDELMDKLADPSFTDEWQYARAQIVANPMFKDYMDLRGFNAGQEDDAVRQLFDESRPLLRRQAAASRMSRNLENESDLNPLAKTFGTTKKQREALRVSAEGRGEDSEYGQSIRQTGREAREDAGIDPDKTMFQDKDIKVGEGAQVSAESDQPEQSETLVATNTSAPVSSASRLVSGDTEGGQPQVSIDQRAKGRSQAILDQLMGAGSAVG
tara:strand:- start:7171 stop:8853 length:1683 start_codon:yes stop_codon:yes gene_type:complete